MIKIISFITIMLLTACSNGFDRGKLQQQLSGLPLQVNDQSIKDIRLVRAQLKKPFKIAIALTDSEPSYLKKWRWEADDKELLEKFGNELKSSGIAADVFLMSNMFINVNTLSGRDPGENGIMDFRKSAARHGADAVLVINGAADIDSYVNASSVLYLTIVGTFFVPGNHRDALFMVQGGLIDVNNGYLYASAEAEAEKRTVRPSYFSEDKDAVNPAKLLALSGFLDELKGRLINQSW